MPALRQSMTRTDLGLVLWTVLLAIILSVEAQIDEPKPQTWEWQFSVSAQTASTSLPSCATLALTANPRAAANGTLLADGIPPFYMTAFPVNGIPSVAFIGTNESDLTWTVKYPVGTKLLLGLVDSHGTSGGIDTPLYTVSAGETSDCLPSPPSDTSFKITTNVTDALDTCQPWGLTVEGGTPPYHVTIATLNSPNITNITFGTMDSVLTYINRTPPGNQMIATASDVSGRWASGNPFVRTQGAQDIDCIGLVTTTHGIEDENSTSQEHHSLSHRTKIWIIVGAALGAVLIVGAIFAVFILRRRRKESLETSEITPFSRESNASGGNIVAYPLESSLYAARATSKIAPSSRFSTGPESSSSITGGTMVFASPHPDLAELPPPYPKWP
ncbi:hypothetical protein R3P38DRAFT_3026444 [Favolaschia claudopus]|uniref:Uncharacterized protein n=1 Tax=Favolaschia claudopus TaxID=2862362 RepID=A0AAW0AFP1_9AGAR